MVNEEGAYSPVLLRRIRYTILCTFFTKIDMQPAGSRASALAAAVAQTVCGMSIRSACETVVQLITERTASEEAVNFPLPLAVALDDDTTGQMSETDATIRLIHLLPALAGTTHELLLQVRLSHAELLHAEEKFRAFLR